MLPFLQNLLSGLGLSQVAAAKVGAGPTSTMQWAMGNNDLLGDAMGATGGQVQVPYRDPAVPVPDGSGESDWGRKLGQGALNATTGALDYLGSIDRRLTDVRVPVRPMGQFAPNDNRGLVGLEQLLQMIAAGRR